MIFADRLDAADRLADALAAYRDRHPLVLAIPRGAVPMGQALAERLGGEMDVVLVHKLRAPGNPEFAIGAVDESGWLYVSPYANTVGADEPYLARERDRQLEALRSRRASYTPERPPIDPAGRIAIVVDDGLATGATMIAALHAVRSKKPNQLICAVPVGAPDSLRLVAPYADEVLCLHAPPDFRAVGQYYARFEQVTDEEVIACLRHAAEARPRAAPS